MNMPGKLEHAVGIMSLVALCLPLMAFYLFRRWACGLLVRIVESSAFVLGMVYGLAREIFRRVKPCIRY